MLESYGGAARVRDGRTQTLLTQDCIEYSGTGQNTCCLGLFVARQQAWQKAA